jgi:hypothetical protein
MNIWELLMVVRKRKYKKKLPAKDRKEHLIPIRLTTSEYQEFGQAAEEEKMTYISHLARRLILDYLVSRRSLR